MLQRWSNFTFDLISRKTVENTTCRKYFIRHHAFGCWVGDLHPNHQWADQVGEVSFIKPMYNCTCIMGSEAIVFIDLWGVLHVCLFSYKNLSPGAFVSDLKASPRCVLLQERAGRANYWEKPGGQLALKYKLVGRHNHTISKYKQIFKRPVSSVVHISSISG